MSSTHEVSEDKLALCRRKVESLEELVFTYSGNENNMKASQTNLGIFSIGVEQSNNNYDCSRFWGVLEILAAIGLAIIIIAIV